MLPAAQRLTDADSYRTVVRRGRRAGSTTLVVHLLAATDDRADTAGGHGPRVGFVVSTAVGNAVVRNRVRRRLRHLVADQLGGVPMGSLLAIRALPAAAGADAAELGSDLARCLRRVTGASIDTGVSPTKVAT